MCVPAARLWLLAVMQFCWRIGAVNSCVTTNTSADTLRVQQNKVADLSFTIKQLCPPKKFHVSSIIVEYKKLTLNTSEDSKSGFSPFCQLVLREDGSCDPNEGCKCNTREERIWISKNMTNPNGEAWRITGSSVQHEYAFSKIVHVFVIEMTTTEISTMPTPKTKSMDAKETTQGTPPAVDGNFANTKEFAIGIIAAIGGLLLLSIFFFISICAMIHKRGDGNRAVKLYHLQPQGAVSLPLPPLPEVNRSSTQDRETSHVYLDIPGRQSSAYTALTIPVRAASHGHPGTTGESSTAPSDRTPAPKASPAALPPAVTISRQQPASGNTESATKSLTPEGAAGKAVSNPEAVSGRHHSDSAAPTEEKRDAAGLFTTSPIHGREDSLPNVSAVPERQAPASNASTLTNNATSTDSASAAAAMSSAKAFGRLATEKSFPSASTTISAAALRRIRSEQARAKYERETKRDCSKEVEEAGDWLKTMKMSERRTPPQVFPLLSLPQGSPSQPASSPHPSRSNTPTSKSPHSGSKVSSCPNSPKLTLPRRNVPLPSLPTSPYLTVPHRAAPSLPTSPPSSETSSLPYVTTHSTKTGTRTDTTQTAPGDDKLSTSTSTWTKSPTSPNDSKPQSQVVPKRGPAQTRDPVSTLEARQQKGAVNATATSLTRAITKEFSGLLSAACSNMQKNQLERNDESKAGESPEEYTKMTRESINLSYMSRPVYKKEREDDSTNSSGGSAIASTPESAPDDYTKMTRESVNLSYMSRPVYKKKQPPQ